MANELQTHWKYPLTVTSEDKTLSRVGTPQGRAFEAIGVDGSIQGGIRPIGGFRKIYELDFYDDDLHDDTSVVTDFFPVNFRVGAKYYGFGFVYRAIRSRSYGGATSDPSINTTSQAGFTTSSGMDLGTESTSSGGQSAVADVFIDFWDSTSQLGSTTSAFGTVGLKLMSGVSGLAQMDVQVFGRLIYVFVSGRDPALFYIKSIDEVQAVPSVTTSSSGSTSSGTSGNAASVEFVHLGLAQAGPFPGPGRQPILKSPKNATPLGLLAVPNATISVNRPMVGQIVMTAQGPAASGLFQTEEGVSSSSSELTDLSSESSVSYSDPTSSCSALTSSGPTSPPPIVGALINTPISSTFTCNGVPSPGLLNAPHNQSLVVYFRRTGPVGFGCGTPSLGTISMPETVQVYMCTLEAYLENPAVMDTPFTTLTTTPGVYGQISSASGRVTFQPGNLMPNVTYLWGMRAFNGRTPCGFAIGNADNAIPGGSHIPENVTEAQFINLIGGAYKFRVAESLPPPGSSEDLETVLDKFSAELFEPGDYSFGVFLYDSKTGRKSSFSEIAEIRKEDFSSGLTSELSEDVASRYLVVEMGYDPAIFDQAYIFRSVKVQDAGGTFIASIMHLDAVINLRDYETNLNNINQPWDPAITDYKHVCYWYRLEDKQLVQQEVYYDQTIFDESMPKGGTALYYGNTMFVSKIVDGTPKSTQDGPVPDEATRGLGEMRWSSLTQIAPELFPPAHRYVPPIPSNEVIKFKKVGANAIGFSRDRLYHIRREGFSVKSQEMHEGYGIVGHKAVEAVGSLLYFVTPKGIKAVSSLGELSDVRVFDHLVIDTWSGQLEDVSVAFDPEVGAVFIHNPDLEQTAVLWMTTEMVTEIHDMVFHEVKQGSWPTSVSDYTSTLVDRALFLQNPTISEVTGLPPTYTPPDPMKPRIYLLDHRRTRTISGSTMGFSGDPRYTLLNIIGDSRFATDAAITNRAISFNGTPTLFRGCEGGYVYCLDSSDVTFIGKKAVIHTVDSDGKGLICTSNSHDLVGLPSGSRIGISPVYFRWVGANLSLQDDDGNQFSNQDFHRVKQLQAMGASFVDVSGTPVGDETSSSSSGYGDGTTDAKYEALVYKGTESTPNSKAFPRSSSNVIVPSVHEIEGERWAAFGSTTTGDGKHGVMGVSLSPGIQVYCPDLDFRLLSVICRGVILDSETTRRGSV